MRKFISISVENYSRQLKGKKVIVYIDFLQVMFGESKSTAEGLEIHMGVNHLGHFLLTNLLETNLVQAAQDHVSIPNHIPQSLQYISMQTLLLDPSGANTTSVTYNASGKKNATQVA
jgi:NAD(P)-dependent dehydrogenase (short-subunit alcohol dehydrogenase family)